MTLTIDQITAHLDNLGVYWVWSPASPGGLHVELGDELETSIQIEADGTYELRRLFPGLESLDEIDPQVVDEDGHYVAERGALARLDTLIRLCGDRRTLLEAGTLARLDSEGEWRLVAPGQAWEEFGFARVHASLGEIRDRYHVTLGLVEYDDMGAFVRLTPNTPKA